MILRRNVQFGAAPCPCAMHGTVDSAVDVISQQAQDAAKEASTKTIWTIAALVVSVGVVVYLTRDRW